MAQLDLNRGDIIELSFLTKASGYVVDGNDEQLVISPTIMNNPNTLMRIAKKDVHEIEVIKSVNPKKEEKKEEKEPEEKGRVLKFPALVAEPVKPEGDAS